MQLLRQCVVARKQTCSDRAQRDHTGTREGGDVDHRLRFETFGIGQCIAQHQTAFGIGVQNFNGLTAHAGDHITGFDREAIGHVFGGWNQAHHVDGRLQMRQGLENAEHTGRAAHVVLHLVHLGRWFDGDTARVKSDALAHQNHWGLGSSSPLVTHDNEAQRLCRPLGHGHESPHAQLGHLFGAQHLALEGFALGDVFGRLGQVAGGGVVGGTVGPLFGQLHSRNQRLGMLDCQLVGSGGVLSADQHLLERPGFGLAQSGGVAVTGIGQAGQGRLQTLGRCIPHQVQAQMLDSGGLECIPGRLHGAADLTGLVVAGTHHHQMTGQDAGLAIQRHDSARLQLEIALLHGLGHPPGDRVMP